MRRESRGCDRWRPRKHPPPWSSIRCEGALLFALRDVRDQQRGPAILLRPGGNLCGLQGTLAAEDEWALCPNRDALSRYGTLDRQVNGGLASSLRSYQAVADVPGPLLGAALLVALLGALGFGCMQKSRLQSASFLFAGTGLAVCLGSVAVSHLSIRYQLPQVALLPPAAAAALAGLWRPQAHPAENGSLASGASHRAR
jgi:hypothetical protein